jgi:sulfane dehydrogenase subunit SoxC
MVPGFEGIFHTKYLRRIKIVDQYYMNYNDFGHLDQDAKVAALEYQIGPKSVITFPSGEQRLPGKGFYEISGLAWSGGRRDQVGGSVHRRREEMERRPSSRARRSAWPLPVSAISGIGTERDRTPVALHRRTGAGATDARPDRQVLEQTLRSTFSVPGLDNSVQPWHIASDGSVTNGFA